jgi:hypothetical protein
MAELDNIILDFIRDGLESTFDKIEQKFTNDYGEDFIAFATKELENQKGLIAFKLMRAIRQALTV